MMSFIHATKDRPLGGVSAVIASLFDELFRWVIIIVSDILRSSDDSRDSVSYRVGSVLTYIGVTIRPAGYVTRRLRNSKLRNSRLRNSRLRNSKLRNSRLRNSMLCNSRLRNSKLRNSR